MHGGNADLSPALLDQLVDACAVDVFFESSPADTRCALIAVSSGRGDVSGGPGLTIGQLSAFVYRDKSDHATRASLELNLYGPFGSVKILVQFDIAAISP